MAMDLEGTEICEWITVHGVTCVVLKYRTPQQWRWGANGVRQAPEVLLPLEAAQRAVPLLRLGASSYGIDTRKIGAIDFSAGGHLTAELSNAETCSYRVIDAADRQSFLPDFAILL